MVAIYYFVHLNWKKLWGIYNNFDRKRDYRVKFLISFEILGSFLKESSTFENKASNRLFMSQAIKSTTNYSFSFPITAVFPSFKLTTLTNLQRPDQHVLQYLKSKLHKASNPCTHFWITGNKNLTPSKVFCRLKVGLRFFFLLDYLETKFP